MADYSILNFSKGLHCLRHLYIDAKKIWRGMALNNIELVWRFLLVAIFIWFSTEHWVFTMHFSSEIKDVVLVIGEWAEN